MGTLTEGKPKVPQVITTEATEEELLPLAYTLEEYSMHPIAKAVVEYVKEQGLSPLQGDKFRNLVGKGVLAKIGDQEYYVGNLKLFLE